MKTPRICRNGICPVDYPHAHQQREDGWMPSINDPVVPASWPDRLHWQRPSLPRSGLFQFGWFGSHSGFQLPWKLDLDSFQDSDWESIAQLIAWKFAFRAVYGIPKGGDRLADALTPHCEPGYPVLIVDDVSTTGNSLREARARLNLLEEPVIGVVVVARGPVPDWVFPILSVNEWSQSRATGLG